MKYYIIAGEASGDLHGANLIECLQRYDKKAIVRCWGGDLMAQAGGTVVKHYRDLAFMGFVEVLQNIRTIWQNIQWCKADLLDFQPDVLVLIDYPGFNLRIAPFAKQNDIKVVYYVSPQVWAWHASRVPKMKKYIDKLLVILPFEQAYFTKKWKWAVEFVGHPLLDAIAKKREYLDKVVPKDLELPIEKPIIALLPGSRKQEIRKKLPIMLSVMTQFPAYQFVVAGAPSLPLSFYEEIMGEMQNSLPIIQNKTYELLQLSTAALVTSGTATLETALLGIPQVVCYKGNPISYYIARWLVDLKYISLVNLILDKPAVTELIQEELTKENLSQELQAILPNGTKHPQIKADYDVLKTNLGGGGASQKAAEWVFIMAQV